MDHLDISQVRSRDRIVTQAMSRALYERRYAGVRFGSNLDDRPCYALFEGRAELRRDGDPLELAPDLEPLAAGLRRVRAPYGGRMIERMPAFAGSVTLAVGVALLAAPRLVTGPLGLDGQDGVVRAIGVSDLVLVPGLLRGSPRWPWMLARAAFNLGDAAYLHRMARGRRRRTRSGRERP